MDLNWGLSDVFSYLYHIRGITVDVNLDHFVMVSARFLHSEVTVENIIFKIYSLQYNTI